MKYEKLDATQQRQMLEARLLQYEGEHFGHATNLALLEASAVQDDSTKEAIEAAKAAMKVLDDAHANVKAELTKVKV